MTGAVQEDKRIRRTKKLLRQALTRLMQQKDFQSITVTDVVREADINRGTFYAHYRDVYDLREKIEAEMIEDFRELIADLHPERDEQSSAGPGACGGLSGGEPRDRPRSCAARAWKASDAR